MGLQTDKMFCGDNNFISNNIFKRIKRRNLINRFLMKSCQSKKRYMHLLHFVINVCSRYVNTFAKQLYYLKSFV